jgi:type III secretory pathway component EscU
VPEQLRPFPPSPRRRALARHAGIHAASPLLVGALAAAALLVTLALSTATSRASAWFAAAARLEPALAMRDVAGAVAVLVGPLLLIAAVIAALAHVVQASALWLPRRRIAGAPSIEPARVRRASFDLISAAVIGATAFGWLWLAAPRIAMLSSVPLAAALAIASAAASFVIAYVVLGIADALLRHRELANALQMTAQEKREDERLSGADPRWRNVRARVSNELAPDLGGATLLVLGDDVAVAIAWDPLRRPIPAATAIGRGTRATQLLALARRRRVPVHRDAELASALAGEPRTMVRPVSDKSPLVEDTRKIVRPISDKVIGSRSPTARPALIIDAGPVAERHWPRLAEVVAAVRR